jgi:hypothetical protein
MRRSLVLGLSCVVPLFTLQCGSSGDTASNPAHGYEGGVGGTGGDSGLTDGQAKDSAGGDAVVGSDSGDATTEDVVPTLCTPGLIECKSNVKKVCQADGTWGAAEDCGTKICSSILGCVTCLPGTGTCTDANTAHSCTDDGSGFVDETCDSLLGSSCDQGACTGPCAPQVLGKNYIGCDYYPTVTVNSLLSNGSAHFAVAVSNTTTTAATVTITQGATTIATVSVDADSVQVVNLPWTDLRTASATTLTADGAYHLRSTQPVTVYQFNPLEYTAGGENTYTNDASLLLPVTAWNLSYIVAARNNWVYASNMPGFYSVVASQDDTAVTLAPSPTGGSVRTGGGVPANGVATITLNAGGVLQVLSDGDGSIDVTGTLITSTKPVEVFGGHDCTFVPSDVGYCDHIEESMFPVSALSKEYIVSAPVVPGQAAPGYAFTRVIAAEDGTTSLTYDPPNAGWPASVAQLGAYIEVNDNSAFRVTADKKVLVSQYMQGNGGSSVPGDPAMALAVTTPQFRNAYLFHAPTNYQNNYVNVIAPDGTSVLLDGTAVSTWGTIGGTGYSVARVPLDNSGNGNHHLSSVKKAGITVYGYGVDTSYWYPGGLNLTDM